MKDGSEDLERQGIGVCVRKIDGTVTAQNACSRKECGDRVGTSCPWARFGACQATALKDGLAGGTFRFTNERTETGVFDVLVVHKGDEITTLTCPVEFPDLTSVATSDLSPREREVLRHVAAGRSRAEIAARLGISENTVKTHLRLSYRKLGAEGRERLQRVRALRRAG